MYGTLRLNPISFNSFIKMSLSYSMSASMHKGHGRMQLSDLWLPHRQVPGVPDAFHASGGWLLMQADAASTTRDILVPTGQCNTGRMCTFRPSSCFVSRMCHTVCHCVSTGHSAVPRCFFAVETSNHSGNWGRGGCIALSAVCLHCSTAGRPPCPGKRHFSLDSLDCAASCGFRFRLHLPMYDAQWLALTSLEAELPSQG
ncbi:hypothetical protein B0J13DRAFT_5310 [Dactylonectria estremocensis]|uniref:Uncharacterized protein n=1 Tax=Dactylonectria estremocensis TaxID=1079267 RepID=A0A9P9FI49_9HYPO|nr:hypothetical protein B0J13DRAFT_5310 [Dactylonectria estremocensis]